ncbi:hypothetical protein SOPP22_10375 [Shewanella sp. OPT22]|nr:hypothetical protein SOPP22_10375 [Shewanella sp. OPT22]
MDRVKTSVISILLGLAFAYLSIAIIGYAAAIPISEQVLKPLMQLSSTFAFALINFFTSGIPLAIVYCFFAVILNFLYAGHFKLKFSLLALPFFLLHFGLLVISSHENLFTLLVNIPQYITVFLAVLWVQKSKLIGNKA